MESTDQFAVPITIPIPKDRISLTKEPVVNVSYRLAQQDECILCKFSGKDMHLSIVNGVRRCLSEIPIYAFHQSGIIIDTESSRNRFNHSEIKDQLQNLHIPDIPNHFDLVDENGIPERIKEELFGELGSVSDVIEDNDNNGKFLIELDVNYTNTGTDIHFLGSHDLTYTVNGTVSDAYKKNDDISLLDLRPGDSISFHATASLGIQLDNAIYAAVATPSACDEGDFIRLSFQTLGQLSAPEIVWKACVIMEKKLTNLLNYVTTELINRPVEKDKMISITLYGQDDTIGYLLASTLQRCKKITKAGYFRPHLMEHSVTITYYSKNHNGYGILVSCVEYLINLFASLIHQIGILSGQE